MQTLSDIGSFFGSTWGKVAGIFGSLGTIGLVAWLSAIPYAGPIISGIANAIGAVITAVFEIVASLSKSPEGRVVLAIVFAGLGFLYLRFHYIEEGKTLAPTKIVTRIVRPAPEIVTRIERVAANCPAPVKAQVQPKRKSVQ